GDLVADNLKVGILVVFEIHILEVAFAAVVLFHHRDQVGGAVQIIEVAAVRIDVAVHAGNPGIFVIGVVGQGIVQGTNAGLRIVVAVKHIPQRIIADQEVCMVHRAVGFHAVTHHDLAPNVGVAGVHIVPLAVHLDRIPEVVGAEVGLWLAIHRDSRLEGDAHHIDNVGAFTGFYLTGGVIIHIDAVIQALPLGRIAHVGVRTGAVDFGVHILNQVGKRLGIAHADRSAAGQRADVVAFPVAQNAGGQALCSHIGIDGNSLIGRHIVQLRDLLGFHHRIDLRRNLLVGCGNDGFCTITVIVPDKLPGIFCNRSLIFRNVGFRLGGGFFF